MTFAPGGNFLGTEYDDFLFASIGEDDNGMLLSVVSALVRLEVDPWQEAAELSRLSVAAAVKRLGALIAALPDQPIAKRDGALVAARVIALLPRSQAGIRLQSPDHMFRLPSGGRLGYGVTLLLALLIIGVILLANSQIDPGPGQAATHRTPHSDSAR